MCVKQESLFYWHVATLGMGADKVRFGDEQHRDGTTPLYSAFTVAELGEMLPNDVNDAALMMDKTSDEYRVWYANPNEDDWPFDLSIVRIARTEADARAKMLIYLLENKLITL